MATLNKPVDQMFRAGQISGKEWARLSMNANGKGGKTHGRMANFDAKTKDEAGSKEIKSVGSTKKGHIDGPDQGMGARGAFTPPTRGGGVKSGARNAEVTNNELSSPARQKPDWPRQGSGRKPGVRYKKHQPSSSNSNETGKNYYGGPARRREAPQRLPKSRIRV